MAIATGDFNGDGVDDLAIGVPSGDFDSLPCGPRYCDAQDYATFGHALGIFAEGDSAGEISGGC